MKIHIWERQVIIRDMGERGIMRGAGESGYGSAEGDRF